MSFIAFDRHFCCGLVIFLMFNFEEALFDCFFGIMLVYYFIYTTAFIMLILALIISFGGVILCEVNV